MGAFLKKLSDDIYLNPWAVCINDNQNYRGGEYSPDVSGCYLAAYDEQELWAFQSFLYIAGAWAPNSGS
jgi:hypothetical protein